MVRAILDGRKTQTRRVIMPQPDIDPKEFTAAEVNEAWQAGFVDVKCPHGEVGDLLWVRETYGFSGWNVGDVYYRADKHDAILTPWWRPSTLMPKAFSRITLEITDVRVERLQDISEEDAIAEGMTLPRGLKFGSNPIEAFRVLWDSINGKDDAKNWQANPWVWVIEFEPHFMNVDAMLEARKQGGDGE